MAGRTVFHRPRGLPLHRAARPGGAGDEGMVLLPLLVLGGAVALVAAVIAVPMLFVASCTGTSEQAAQPGASDDANAIPGNYLRLYQQAGQQYGIPWNVLAGIGGIESDHGRSTLPGVRSGANPWGAAGPMQIGIGGAATNNWGGAARHPANHRTGGYGRDANGDGWADVHDPADAIPAAARKLKADGAPGRLRSAILRYNPSSAYVADVMKRAARYASGGFSITGDNAATTACLPGGAATHGSPNGPLGQRIIYFASKWLRTPYLWGGGDQRGPTKGCAHGFCGTGFDCSGLSLYAVYQATGGKVDLPHHALSQSQHRQVRRVGYAQLQPGDLVFFHGDYGHMGIYIGGGKMIHAPQTGDAVREDDISRGHWRSEFVAAGRVIA